MCKCLADLVISVVNRFVHNSREAEMTKISSFGAGVHALRIQQHVDGRMHFELSHKTVTRVLKVQACHLSFIKWQPSSRSKIQILIFGTYHHTRYRYVSAILQSTSFQGHRQRRARKVFVFKSLFCGASATGLELEEAAQKRQGFFRCMRQNCFNTAALSFGK